MAASSPTARAATWAPRAAPWRSRTRGGRRPAEAPRTTPETVVFCTQRRDRLCCAGRGSPSNRSRGSRCRTRRRTHDSSNPRCCTRCTRVRRSPGTRGRTSPVSRTNFLGSRSNTGGRSSSRSHRRSRRHNPNSRSRPWLSLSLSLARSWSVLLRADSRMSRAQGAPKPSESLSPPTPSGRRLASQHLHWQQ